jgi:hypothetical protein
MRRIYTSASAARTAIESPNRNGAMRSFVSTLTAQQRSDVSAYVADIRAEGNAFVSAGMGPAMSVPAVGQSSEITVTLSNNGRGTMTIQSNGITRSGPNATEFAIGPGRQKNCFTLSVSANDSCQVTVTFTASGSASGQRSATLNFAHNGEPVNTTSLSLTGTVGAAPPPPSPPPATSGGGGGGAMSPGWLALLLPAALLGRRQLRAVRRATD